MRRRCAVIAITVPLVALSPLACGGSEDEKSRTTPPPTDEAPPERTAPQADIPGLPPGFAECMGRRGYEIRSSADIHAAPPQVLQACFGH